MSAEMREHRIHSKKHDILLSIFKRHSLLQSHFLRHVVLSPMPTIDKKEIWKDSRDKSLNDRHIMLSRLETLGCPALLLDRFNWIQQSGPCGACPKGIICFNTMKQWLDLYVSATLRTIQECIGGMARHAHYKKAYSKKPSGKKYLLDKISCLSDHVIYVVIAREGYINNSFNVTTSYSDVKIYGNKETDLKDRIIHYRIKIKGEHSLGNGQLAEPIFCTNDRWLVK